MKKIIKQSSKNKFGQYFTPRAVADFMISLANISQESKILEPSCGEGIFLELLQEKGFNELTAYEIDKDLLNNSNYNLNSNLNFIHYESFISAKIDEKFDLIIGNPPYIRWKNLEDNLKSELLTNIIWNKYFNSFCDYLYIFILKSIELLNENGQLIFICPEYWMNTTHSITLRNYIVQNGYFEKIYHFNETPIFDNVAASIIIFKFVKNKGNVNNTINNTIKIVKFHANQKITSTILDNLKNQIEFIGAKYLDVAQFKVNERWLLQDNDAQDKLKKFEAICCNKTPNPSSYHLFDNDEIKELKFNTIGEFCDIGNGLVSGLDRAFQITEDVLNNDEKLSTINVIKGKDLNPFFSGNITKYIYINANLEEGEFQKIYPNFYLHFQKYKTDLEKRYQYNREIKYWEWVFLRNINLFKKNEKRIFVPCKERISHKNYFRFALADEGIFPTQDVTAIFKKPDTKESIEYILAYLNQKIIFDWLKCNGIVKGNIVEFSERPIASIPFKAIDWTNENEANIHNLITSLTREYIKNKNEKLPHKIGELFNQLF